VIAQGTNRSRYPSQLKAEGIEKNVESAGALKKINELNPAGRKNSTAYDRYESIRGIVRRMKLISAPPEQ
jgi:hypothetical protein